MKQNPTPREAAQTATPIRLDELDAILIKEMISRFGLMTIVTRCEIVPIRIELHNKFKRFIGFIECNGDLLYHFVPAPGVIPYTPDLQEAGKK